MFCNKLIYGLFDEIEVVYYDVLVCVDLDVLMDLWVDDEEIVCIYFGV